MWLQPSFLLAVLASCFFLTAAHAQTQDTPARFQTDDELINQVSQAQSDDELFDTRHSKTWLEVWGFHDAQGSDSAVNTIQPRLYHSFPIGTSGAQGLTRLDTSFNSTSGPLHSGSGGGAFNPTTTRWTMAAYTPETDQRLTFGGGFRMMLPTGYNNPAYSPSQWAMGPQLSMTYTPKNAGTFSFFSPTLRYMMGMTPVAP